MRGARLGLVGNTIASSVCAVKPMDYGSNERETMVLHRPVA